MPFRVHILQKRKVCIIHKDTPFSEKWQNVHGNIIHCIIWLISIGDKNLEIQVNYFI